MARPCARVAIALLAALVPIACGSTGRESTGRAVAGSSVPSSIAIVPVATVPGTAASPQPPSLSTTIVARTTATVVSTPATTSVPDPALARVGSAGQAVIVTAARYGGTAATMTAYQRDGAGWQVAFGPWSAHLGSRGIAPPGEKREGDGRTPSGVYGFDFFFGVAPDPGVRFPYRRVTSRSVVWDDDPDSPRYNTWVDLDMADAGRDPEPMYVTPAYDHGAVIAYNDARTPGLGSAIFLHVSTGAATAGCVSLPAGDLVELLRWLDPARDPRIVIGVAR